MSEQEHVNRAHSVSEQEHVSRPEECPDARLAGGQPVSARGGSLCPHVSLHPPPGNDDDDDDDDDVIM